MNGPHPFLDEEDISAETPEVVLCNTDGTLFDDEVVEPEPVIPDNPAEAPAKRWLLRYICANFSHAEPRDPISRYAREEAFYAKASATRRTTKIIAEGLAWGDAVEVCPQKNSMRLGADGKVFYQDVTKDIVEVCPDGRWAWGQSYGGAKDFSFDMARKEMRA